MVHGTPRDWFAPYGWDVHGADGSDWEQVTRGLMGMVAGAPARRRPA